MRPETLEAGLSKAEVVTSVYIPEFALDVGQMVYDSGFDGVFCDANAIAPSTALIQANRFEATHEEGCIVGPPA